MFILMFTSLTAPSCMQSSPGGSGAAVLTPGLLCCHLMVAGYSPTLTSSPGGNCQHQAAKIWHLMLVKVLRASSQQLSDWFCEHELDWKR